MVTLKCKNYHQEIFKIEVLAQLMSWMSCFLSLKTLQSTVSQVLHHIYGKNVF